MWKTHLILGGTIVLTGLATSVSLGSSLKTGDEAPRPDVVDQENAKVDWDAVFKSRFVLVYFYPKADTPGCTKQACSLRDAYGTLTEKGVAVLGVSGDKPGKQKAFKEKHSLPFSLVADTEHKLMDAYGVPNLAGIAKRQAFLFENGKLIWSDKSASTEKQAQDVLEAIAGK